MHSSAETLYPRVGMAHPYESWYKSGFHSTISGEVANGASTWWDVHTNPGSWLEVQNPAGSLQSSLHSGTPQAIHSQLSSYNPDFSSLTHSAFSSTGISPTASHLLSTSQHLLTQEGFKTVIPTYTDASATTAMISGASSGIGTSSRSSRRYSGRATCDCPNCHEAERLGPREPACGGKDSIAVTSQAAVKSTGKTSHLKAHLRWAHWREALCVQLAFLRQTVHQVRRAPEAPAHSHRREAVCLPGVQQALHEERPPEQTHQNAHRWRRRQKGQRQWHRHQQPGDAQVRVARTDFRGCKPTGHGQRSVSAPRVLSLTSKAFSSFRWIEKRKRVWSTRQTLTLHWKEHFQCNTGFFCSAQTNAFPQLSGRWSLVEAQCF